MDIRDQFGRFLSFPRSAWERAAATLCVAAIKRQSQHVSPQRRRAAQAVRAHAERGHEGSSDFQSCGALPKKETKFSAALLQLVFPIEIITLPQFWVVYRGTPVRAGCSLFI
jgi:hypothetical protein